MDDVVVGFCDVTILDAECPHLVAGLGIREDAEMAASGEGRRVIVLISDRNGESGR